jgi:hypothetical protein
MDNYTKLLLHGDESPFVDSSNSTHTVTNNNSVTRSTTESKFGGYSMGFNGTNNYISVASHDDFNITSGDWTIDFWYWLPSPVKQWNGCIYLGTADFQAFGIYFKYHKLCMVYDTTGTSTWEYNNHGASHESDAAETWHHVACVRSGTDIIAFVDGEVKFSHTQASNLYLNNYTLKIGAHYSLSAGYYFPGYIDEVRFSKGIARWTEAFTVPSSPYSAYTISGNSSEDSRIIVLNENDWSLETTEEVTSGSYSVTTTSGNKTVIARKSDGECVGYGNVSPSTS